MKPHSSSASTRPYLLRALHEWCTDNGFTPYVTVSVDDSVKVPRDFVRNGEIVLNVSYDATGGLTLGNDYITFQARFGGVARDIVIPVGRVSAIYARENGQGMAFPPVEQDIDVDAGPMLAAVKGAGEASSELVVQSAGPEGEGPVKSARPVLTRIK